MNNANKLELSRRACCAIHLRPWTRTSKTRAFSSWLAAARGLKRAMGTWAARQSRRGPLEDADLWTRVVAFVPVGRWDRLRLVSSSARDAVARAATQPPYDGSFLIFS